MKFYFVWSDFVFRDRASSSKPGWPWTHNSFCLSFSSARIIGVVHLTKGFSLSITAGISEFSLIMWCKFLYSSFFSASKILLQMRMLFFYNNNVNINNSVRCRILTHYLLDCVCAVSKVPSWLNFSLYSHPSSALVTLAPSRASSRQSLSSICDSLQPFPQSTA